MGRVPIQKIAVLGKYAKLRNVNADESTGPLLVLRHHLHRSVFGTITLFHLT
jgi:hypothetical protein